MIDAFGGTDADGAWVPDEMCKVYRLQTDDGERIIGRVISAAGLPILYRNLGQSVAGTLNVETAWQSVVDGSVLHLADGLQVRRARVMNEYRVELCGFSDAMRDRLRAYGLFAEIIAWKLRFFVPVGDSGATVLKRVMDWKPPVALAARAAA